MSHNLELFYLIHNDCHMKKKIPSNLNIVKRESLLKLLLYGI